MMNVLKKIMSALRNTLLEKLKYELNSLRLQVTECLSELNGLQQRVTEFCSEIEGFRKQIIEIRSELAGTQQEIALLLSEFSVNRKNFLALRYHACCPPDGPIPSEANLKKVFSISEQYDQLKHLAAHAYALWRPLIDVNKGAYEGLPIDSCSVPGHPMATLFRFFLAPYLKGRVLDIGCGPQAVPSYLEGYPVEALYGIDPLSEPINHPFKFFKGLAEFLPWTDAQFNLVIAATSLDHVLLLDKVFTEVRRVLRPDGCFVVWISFIPGSKHYDPYQKTIEKVDKYHLFHFDREWFLKEIDPFFTVFEEFVFGPTEISTFFALQPRKAE
jgi:SAM-dependent methyltransferase